MKKSWFVAVGIVCLTVCGCVFDDDDGGSDRTPSVNGIGVGEIAQAYMPMKPGTVWYYGYEGLDSDDGHTSQNYDFSLRCQSKFSISGTTYSCLEHSKDHYFDDLIYYDGNDVYYIKPDFSDMYKHLKIPDAEKRAKISEKIHDPGREMLMYRFDVPVNTEWTVFKEYWTPTDYELELYDESSCSEEQITGKYLGREKVVTPAGTFDDCFKFRHSSIIKYKHIYIYDSSPEIIEGTSTRTEEIWIARNYGIVKSHVHLMDGYSNQSGEYTLVVRKASVVYTTSG